MRKKKISFLVFALLLATIIQPILLSCCVAASEENVNLAVDYYSLPLPLSVDMVLEESICRRMSVREFSGETVTDGELSTILWNAYGSRANGKRPIFSPEEQYSTVIYVIRSDGTYKYVPDSNSLSLFRSGDYTNIGSYNSPIKLGLVWDTRIAVDEKTGMKEIGMIGQNIYFNANALDLGTVTTGSNADELNLLGLPSYEKPGVIMPLGRPRYAYTFTYDPLPISDLPTIENNTISLQDVIDNRLDVTIWKNEILSVVEQTQLVWSSYGYSYLIDNLNSQRHRTLPSAWGEYPFKVFAVTPVGVYQYSPNNHAVTLIIEGDTREDIDNSIESTYIMITSAPFIIIPCLDIGVANPGYQGYWNYEAGAIIHNVLLEATALNLGVNAITDSIHEDALRSAIGLSSQTTLVPLAVVPVGRITSDNPPVKPILSGPSNGQIGKEYIYTSVTTDPDGDPIYYLFDWDDGSVGDWVGPYNSGETYSATHTWYDQGTFNIRVKAKDDDDGESGWSDPLFVEIIIDNSAPNKPAIIGPTSGIAGEEYEYIFITTDPELNDVTFYIEWGDGQTEDWIGFYGSGEEATFKHTWSRQKTYIIRARAKDIYDAESDWAEFPVSMPKNTVVIHSLFLRFLQRFSLLDAILLIIS